MYKYLVKTGNDEKIYFYKLYEGICEMTKRGGVWGREVCIYREAEDKFFAYGDDNGVIHIIALNKDMQLVYMRYTDGRWQKFIISTLKNDIKIKRIMIGVNKIGQNLFYSAEYKGEMILVHCVMGDNAMPETVDKIGDENFFISDEKIYYTNENNIMGYKCFSDGKTDNFTACNNGFMPYVTHDESKELKVYCVGADIYVNEECYCIDNGAYMPVLVKNNDRYVLMWKNGDFIRYIPFDMDSRGKRAMQYVSTGIKPDLYVYSDGRSSRYCYGIFSNRCLKFFANANPMGTESGKKENEIYKKNNEISELREKLICMKKEIEAYKNEIIKLNDMINRLKSMSFETDKQ